jgi:hypothetical protein
MIMKVEVRFFHNMITFFYLAEHLGKALVQRCEPNGALHMMMKILSASVLTIALATFAMAQSGGSRSGTSGTGAVRALLVAKREFSGWVGFEAANPPVAVDITCAFLPTTRQHPLFG